MKSFFSPSKPRRVLQKAGLLSTAGIFAVASIISIAKPALADQYDDQINALKAQVSGYQSQVTALAQQADTLQTKIAQLQADENAMQAQINLSQAKHDQLVAQINTTQKKITATQAVLASTIADMYVDSKTTPLEMVASSSNISDYVNAEQYNDVASQQIQDAIKQIKTLKAQLVSQQAEVDKVLADQQNQQAKLDSDRQQQQNILNQTQGSEAAYQNLINSSNSQINQLIQAQIAAQAAKAKSYGGTIAMGSSDPNMGGYPSAWANAAQDSFPDYWNMFNRECVSYAAFKVEQTFGNLDSAASGHPKFYGWGNANDWPAHARAAGYTVNSTPSENSVAQYYDGVAGHVAWVEKVNGDGTVLVSQFNYFSATLGHGKFSTMTVKSSFFDNYIHF